MANPLRAAADRLLAPERRASAFAAARPSRITADFNGASLLSPNAELRWDARVLRARARQLVRDNGYAAGFVEDAANNVIGDQGILLQAKITTAAGELRKDVNRRIEEAWKDWGYPETASADRALSWVELQRLIAKTLVVDGEVFVRKLRGFRNAYGYALQLLDADLVDDTLVRAPTATENEIQMGVEIDAWGAPVAYHVWTRHWSEPGARERVRIAADEILHLFVRYRPDQRRGVSWFAPALTSAMQLDGYETAELVAARVAASAMGFIVNKSAEAVQAWVAAQETSVTRDGETPPRPTFEMEPGTFPELLPGQEIMPFNAERPPAAYKDFTSTVLRAQARGLGTSYMSLTGDLTNANYSSGRMGLLPERDRWRAVQNFCVVRLCRPVYREWVSYALLSGQLVLDSRLATDYRDVKWKPRGWRSVDPKSELEAAGIELKFGLTSRQRICAERGDDYEEIIDELAHEQAYAREAGVDISGPATGAASATAPAVPGEDRAPQSDGGTEGEPPPGALHLTDDRTGHRHVA